jgi:SOS-response transcriptional repressor LexA
MRELTEPSDKQLALLRWIIKYLQRHGFQPSRKEMAKHFGCYQNAIQHHLKVLHQFGFVQLNDERERALIIPGIEITVRVKPLERWFGAPEERKEK